MKTFKRPTRHTIVFGFAFGLAFIPLHMLLSHITDGTTAFRFILWTFLAAYGFFLTRWGGKGYLSVFFPLLLLLVFAFFVQPIGAFLLLLLVILSWIRSGICFRSSLSKTLGAELVLSLGGAVIVAWFSPHSTLTWALGILMFSLVQSIYFVIFDNSDDEDIEMDPFEEARIRAEKIISY